MPTFTLRRMYASREQIASAIAEKLRSSHAALHTAWASSTPVRHVVVDDLLDPAWTRSMALGFPDPASMMRRSTLRERKRVGVAVEAYPQPVQDALFAFHAPAVVAAIGEITGLEQLTADPTLYASGLSVMTRDDFLGPHIDNSHDGDNRNYRVLNLLYYVSEGWGLSKGGNLELWDTAVKTPIPVESRFNRLVIMETTPTSWHSVTQVRVPEMRRCVSNYYFSPKAPGGRDYFHVTTFTGRPEQRLRRLVLNVVDGVVLNAVGRALPVLTKRSRHRRAPAP